ncbi:MAG: hypothetical protein P9X24_18385 [Candidatus Hatepunaea meridiana]|nr:hypothetical protein [Candidatus Hatepunaea meridiana]
MKTTTYSIIILLLSITLSYASGTRDKALEAQIKNTGEYRWGEAVNVDPEKAKDAAKRNLCQNIWVAITATSGHRITETESSFQDSSVMSTQTYSALNLQNLSVLTFNENDMTRAIAYIDNASLSQSFETSKQKVRDMVKLAKQAESEGRIGDALKMLYWAYLRTHTYVGELNLGLDGIEIADARMAIERKMKQLVSNLDIKADPCSRTAGCTNTRLTLTYRGNPVSNIEFSYYCGEGDGDDCISINNGENAYITIFKELTQRRVPLPLRIEYVYPGEMRSQPEILNLYGIFKDKCIDLFVEVDLIASWIPEERAEEARQKSAPLVVKPLPKPASRDWSISVQVLADINSKREFQEELTKLKDAGQLYTASDISQLSKNDGHYLALYCNQCVTALLFFDGIKYKNVRTGREYDSYKDILPAEGEVSVTWIGEVRK